MRFFADPIPKRARLYVLTVIGIGLPLFGACISVSLREDPSWLYLAALTVFGGFFPITVPSAKGKTQALSLTVSDVFVFAAILLFGPEVGVTLSVLDGAISNVRAKINRAYKHLFNVGLLSLASFVSGHVFYILIGETQPLDPSIVGSALWHFLLILAACSFIFYACNSGGVALAISLATGQNFWFVWKENFFWGSLATIAGASVSVLIFLTFETIQLYSIVIAVPIILVVYYAYRMNLNRINEAHHHAMEVGELYHSTIASLAMAIDAKDQYTHGHVQRVQTVALGLAEAAGFSDPSEVEGLRAASLLHDIGKLAIPEYILNKPSGLTEWEARKMKIHPTVGADILASVPFPYPVVPFVRHHHERWDGKGYPDGLHGEEIPLGARILAIADCYDALRSDRPYRPKLSLEATLDYMTAQSGKAYDPRLIHLLVEHVDEFENRILEAEDSVPRSLLRRLEDSWSSAGVDRRAISQTVFHDIASAHKEIQAVYEISRTVGKSLNVSETLALLASKIKNLAPYDTCAIYLLNSQANTLVPYHCAGDYSSAIEEMEFKVGEGVTGWVAANGQTLMNVSPAPDFPEQKELRDIFKSCLSIPLAIDERVLGVITLYAASVDAYDDDHLRLMVTISKQAASAINNAIVYEETQEDAYTDLLTGLPNLRYFKVFGQQELKRAARVKYPVTILMMDLEDFKSVNDRFGHKIGDRALIETGHILRNQMRKSDTCIRYGGDEFVGVLPGVNKALVSSTIERIQKAVDEHGMILEEGRVLKLGISVGAATYPDDGHDLDLLLAIADQAMYRDKMKRTQQRYSAAIIPFDKRDHLK